jgi:hypothetical protein
MIAHLEHSVLRDRKVTLTGDLASNNLKGKRRAINTYDQTRNQCERSALLLPGIRLERRVEPHREQPPSSTRSTLCGGGVVSRCLLIWTMWHHLAALDLRDAGCAKVIM